MTKNLSMMAMQNGIEGGNELKTITILCVTRDCVIRCNENNLGYYLKNFNYDGETKFWKESRKILKPEKH